MRDARKRIEALEAARRIRVTAEDNRPLKISFVAYDPQHEDHGKVAVVWERLPGEVSYRRTYPDQGVAP